MPAKRDYSTAIAEYKAGKSLSQLEKEQHLCRHTLAARLKAQGIPIRSPASYRASSINHHAFDKVTEESAYWVGFLMADGCIYEHSETNLTPRVSLHLARKDRDTIERFREFLSSEHRIRTNTISFDSGDLSYDKLDFGSQHIVDRLAYFGVVPHKTKRAKVLHLENSRHFWRGVIDGDGCLTWSAKFPSFQLVGSQPLMQQFCDYIAEHLNIHTVPRKYKGKNVWTVSLYCRKASKMARHFYTNQAVSLERKLARAKLFITFYD